MAVRTNICAEYEKLIGMVNTLCKTAKNSNETKFSFQTYCKAIKMLEEFQCRLIDFVAEGEKTISNNTSSGTQVLEKDLIALIDARLAELYIETDDRIAGEKCFGRAITHFEECVQQRGDHFDSLLNCYNQYGILCSNRGIVDLAEIYLKKADSLYKEWKKKEEVCSKVDADKFKRTEETQMDSGCVHTLIAISSNGIHRIEVLYTYTLFYLAQLHKLCNRPREAAACCSETLMRQLIINEYKPLEWVTNVLQLSSFYISERQWSEAVQCILAAQRILLKSNMVCTLSDTCSTEGDEAENLLEVRSNIYIAWGKLYLSFLSESKEVCERNQQTNGLQQSGNDQQRSQGEFMWLFPKKFFNKEWIFCEDDKFQVIQISGRKLASNFEEARELFLKASENFHRALRYYRLEGFVSEHISILQDLGSLYLNLIYFEKDISRKCKMHRRRIKLVESLVNQLNRQYYTSTLKQITFQLGETYNQMIELKLNALEPRGSSEESRNQREKRIKKLNYLIFKAIENFKEFLKLFDRSEKKIDSNVETFLLAHLHIARLYSKVVDRNSLVTAHYLTEAFKEYQWILDFFNDKGNHEELIGHMKNEMQLCQEMVLLLPAKIEALKKERNLLENSIV